MRRFARIALVAAAVGALAACDESTTSPAPITSGTIAFNADGDTAYLALGPDSISLIADPATGAASAEWDLWFLALNVRLNTAAGVTATCICANEAVLNDTAAVLAMTAVSEKPDFDAVGTAHVTGATFVANDSLLHRTKPWYKYNYDGAHGVAPTFQVYLVKRGTLVYKLQIINYYTPTGAARYYTIRYEKLAD